MAPSQVALGLLEARADPSVCETSALGYGRKSPEGATPKVGAPSALRVAANLTGNGYSYG